MERGNPVAIRTFPIELPEELVDLLGSPQAVSAKAREALVLELLREERISQGQAARLLSVTRWQIIQLMGQYRIPSGPETAEDIRQELDVVRDIVHES
jgi:predicted HTH domain antitoxin